MAARSPRSLLLLVLWATLLHAAPAEAVELPKAKYPAAVERRFTAPPERTWAAALEVIRRQGGKLVTTDEPSGLIVYSLTSESGDTRTYLNVLMQRSKTSGTIVYVISRNREGRSTTGMDSLFFSSLAALL